MQWFKTAENVLRQPEKFFKAAAKERGLATPLQFMFLNTTLYVIIVGILYQLGVRDSSTYVDLSYFANLLGVGQVFLLTSWLWLAGILGIFLATPFALLGMRLVGGKGTLGGTFRVLCYGSAVLLLAWVPYLSPIAGLYGLYLVVVGLAQAHRVSKPRSLAGLLISWVVMLVIMLALVFTIAFLFAFGAASAD